jgi:TonB family protein
MIWWQYLMLVNIYLLVFYGFYVLLLSKETFFQLNRIYLVAASLLSFFIPLIQSDWVKNLFITQQVSLTIYSSPVMVYQFKPVADTQFTIGQMVIAVYLAGIIFLTGRFIWQMIVLRQIINQPDTIAPYSFFNKIKLNDKQEGSDIIAAHERVHARQWHSADVLLIEAIMIMNWFNPVVYLYRYAIKHIHEFIADRHALKAGTNKVDYAMLLLSQTFDTPVHQLVNPFYNHSLLKQRIMMLQKSKSHRMALVKYGLSAPLFVLMMILSSATVNNSKTIRNINSKTALVFQKQASIPEIEIDAVPSSLINVTNPMQEPVFKLVDQVPEFPGGIEAFGHFLGTNIKYPADMREKGIQGRVIITFVVEKNGALTNLKVVRSVNEGFNKESLRVMDISPKWKPGMQNGKPVRTAYTVPINYTLAK